MQVQDIIFYEVELTTKCNARCPGCSRTLDGDTHPGLKMTEITLKDFIKIFPSNTITGKSFGFSGVYGDPGMAKDLIGICDYLIRNKAKSVVVDTNGGMQNEKFWLELGKLSAWSLGRLKIKFNVDGHKNTNHLYRVNVNWDKLMKNMQSFANGTGWGIWQYIEFDHNLDDTEKARETAEKLGFKFLVRRSSRNYVKKSWKAVTKKKEEGKIVEKEHDVTATNKNILHKKAKAKHQTLMTIDSVKNTKFNDIGCRLIHERRAYVSHDMRLWPCCWFGDMYHDNARKSSVQKGREKLFELEKTYGKDWNDLRHHSLNNIVQHEYYTDVLEASWNTEHEFYIKRCVIECGGHGTRHTVEYVNDKNHNDWKLGVYKNHHYVVNNESYYPKDKFKSLEGENIASLNILASGFKGFYMADQIGLDRIKKINFIDSSSTAIDFKLYLHRHWDPNAMELPQFIKEHNLFDRYKSHDGGTQLIPGTDATLETMWQKELSYWDSYDHFKDVYTRIVKKHHKMIMYHCDILNNWDLLKHIIDDQTDDKKVLWTSNIWYNPYLPLYMSEPDIRSRYIEWANKVPSISGLEVYGKNPKGNEVIIGASNQKLLDFYSKTSS